MNIKSYQKSKLINKIVALSLCVLLMISTCAITASAEDSDSAKAFDDSGVMTDALLLVNADSGEVL